MAAKEALTRSLSAELAPHGMRVVGAAAAGMPETAHDPGGVRAARRGVGHDLGAVAGAASPAGPTRAA